MHLASDNKWKTGPGLSFKGELQVLSGRKIGNKNKMEDEDAFQLPSPRVQKNDFYI